jgi:hypothetical protein
MKAWSGPTDTDLSQNVRKEGPAVTDSGAFSWPGRTLAGQGSPWARMVARRSASQARIAGSSSSVTHEAAEHSRVAPDGCRFSVPACGKPVPHAGGYRKNPRNRWIPGVFPFVRGGGLEPPPPFED